ncbi:MAG: helicase-related protein [Anaerolineales bacterium]
MNNNFTPTDLSKILDGLKDFQRQTVDYVFHRLYTAEDPTRRFLIADEVGLGKTLVARGIIARALEHLWDKVDRLDIVYICSNADIARQNINRLNLTGQPDFALASRITLLPTQIQNLRNNRVNFISFTPSTSFDMKSGMGIAEERVLLYWLLQEAWGFRSASALNVLQGDMDPGRFRYRVQNTFSWENVEANLAKKFIEDLSRYPNLRATFDELCEVYKRTDSQVPFDARRKRFAWIGSIRNLLARSCLTALEPDLIILDEFQRFKHLLNDESTDSELAQHLFNYSTEHDAARVILLSATPYKMYTLSHEESEDHYQDFVQTLSFLLNDPAKTNHLRHLITEYRQEVFRLREGDISKLQEIKTELEQLLRRVMVRTERLAASLDRNGMLVQVPSSDVALKPNDLQSYLGLAKVSEILERTAPMEYWKSVPYLLNFMDDYQFKAEFKNSLEDQFTAAEVLEALNVYPQLLLSTADIDNYSQVDPGNARLRSLMAGTLGLGAWQTLWLPPSLPHYKLEEPFSDPTLARFTKRLVFSSWRVVPKAISTFLSYEAERLMFCAFDREAKNTKTARERRRPLLRFSKNNEGRLTGMPVLGIIYPSQVLTEEIDPLHLGSELSNGTIPSLQDVIALAQQRIQNLLKTLPIQITTAGAEDEKWYWAAPILLDAKKHPAFTKLWWQIEEGDGLAIEWSGFYDDDLDSELEDKETDSHWAVHVREAQTMLQEFFAGTLTLGRPPADLAFVLAQNAIAGPGSISLRSMLRIIGNHSKVEELISIKTNAARMAKSLLFLFNLPESTALIRSINREEPYWRRVLGYSAAGGLQAVLDEYVHVLQESLGLRDASPEEISEGISEKICEVLTYKTSTPSIDSITLGVSPEITPYTMRARFALRFGNEKNLDGSEPTRADRVRSAFNSPFWPFVLATTSVGQEGLDFHNYCHAIVHWNLPTNPVDLEQREGRIHRYKGHAVRKNLAMSYDLKSLTNKMGDETDVWKVLFEEARKDRGAYANDLSPYWIYSVVDGAKIERHIPLLPLSRDQISLGLLQQSLAVYRMVFGQNRQEDLLAYLTTNFSPEKLQDLLENLRIDLHPPKVKP